MQYQQKIMDYQQKFLEPLREDLAEWLNKILEMENLTADNFIDMLDNGVLICHLARIIQKKAKEIVDQCNPLQEEAISVSTAKGVPQNRIRCWERAAKGSFFSRENACNFLTFCRDLGIHENLLFESEDLVLHTQPRNVILCLLEVGRIASRLDMEPPGLVQLERDVDEQIQRHSEEINNATPTILIHNSNKAKFSELDKKVVNVALASQAGCRCAIKYCERLKIYKISEGLYRIADRNVFIRLFKDRHVMVRVGGGWDALEHYLIRHDPCRRGDLQNSRSTTPDAPRCKTSDPSICSDTVSSGSATSTVSNSTTCLNETNETPVATPHKKPLHNSTNTRRKYVGRSLTLDLKRDFPSNQSVVSPTSSFTAKTPLSSLHLIKEGNLAVQLTPEPSRTAGFTFARAAVSRNSSFNSGKRNRPAVYDRSKTADLSSLMRPIRP